MKIVHLFLMIAVSGATIHTPAYAAPTSHNPSTNFNSVAKYCGNGVHPNVLQAIARVESGFNPYAIGVVKGQLQRQPRTLAEAIATVKMLHSQGKNFSMGLMQVNRYNLKQYGLSYETVFNVCNNISAGAKILAACYNRAGGKTTEHLHKAFSCYYSGNFRTGFYADFKGQPPYVQKIINSSAANTDYAQIRNLGTTSQVSTSSSQQPVLMPVAQNTQMPQGNMVEQDAQLQTAVLTAPKRNSPDWDIFKEF